jgi:hypothetical protein
MIEGVDEVEGSEIHSLGTDELKAREPVTVRNVD